MCVSNTHLNFLKIQSKLWSDCDLVNRRCIQSTQRKKKITNFVTYTNCHGRILFFIFLFRFPFNVFLLFSRSLNFRWLALSFTVLFIFVFFPQYSKETQDNRFWWMLLLYFSLNIISRKYIDDDIKLLTIFTISLWMPILI